MEINVLKHTLRQLIQEVSKANFYEYYDKLVESILLYRSTGGMGKELYDHLIELEDELGDEGYKEEVILEVLNRLTGFCATSKAIVFPDFNPKTGKFDLSVKMRKINTGDLSQLQHISRTTFLEAFSEDNNPDDMAAYVDESFSLDSLKKEFNNPESQFFFLEINGKVVGYLKLNWGDAQSEDKLKDALEIERIYVLAEHYGKGLGQLLFAKALEFAHLGTYTWMWLGVWAENHRAVNFYRKNGFEAFDTHIFMLGEDAQTDLLMKREMRDENISMSLTTQT